MNHTSTTTPSKSPSSASPSTSPSSSTPTCHKATTATATATATTVTVTTVTATTTTTTITTPTTKSSSLSDDNNIVIDNSSSSNSNSTKTNGMFTPRAYASLSTPYREYYDTFFSNRNTPFKTISSEQNYLNVHANLTSNYEIEKGRHKEFRKDVPIAIGHFKKIVLMTCQATREKAFKFLPNTIAKWVSTGKAGKPPTKGKFVTNNKSIKKRKTNVGSAEGRRKKGRRSNIQTKDNDSTGVTLRTPPINDDDTVTRLLISSSSSSSSSSSFSSSSLSPLRENATIRNIASPTKQNKSTTHQNRCGGIRYAKPSVNMNYLFGTIENNRRLKIEKCGNLLDDYNEKQQQNIPYQKFINDRFPSEFKYDIFIEGNCVAFYSKTCCKTRASSKALRCKACNGIRALVTALVNNALPLGYKNTIIKKKTRIDLIASHPISSRMYIRDLTSILQKKNKIIMKQKFRNKLITQKLERCQPGSVFEDGVIKTFREADSKFDTYMLDHGKDLSGEQKTRTKAMWEVALENLLKANDRKKRLGEKKMNYGVEFDPAILEFAILMLAKTSQSAYELIQPVLKLPSLQWILNLQKQQAGSQDERKGSFGIVGSAVKAFATAFDNKNILDDKLRKMDVCYDSFITVKRIDHDMHNGVVGIDPHLDFRVIRNKFFQMVSLRQIKNCACACACTHCSRFDSLHPMTKSTTVHSPFIFDSVSTKANSESEVDPIAEDIKSGIADMESHLENIAEHFLVFKATPCHPSLDISLTILRQSCSFIDTLRLRESCDALINEFAIYSIGIATITGDGASENVGFNMASCNTALVDFLSNETKSLFAKYKLQKYLEFLVAMADPYSADLILLLEDMPHLVKRKVNNLSNSSKSSECRDLHYGNHSMNLNMIRHIWELSGGTGGELHYTKLRMLHFEKDNFNKQRVYLAVQVVSNSVVIMIKEAFDDDTVRVQLNCTQEQYEPLIQYCTHINKYVDIMNGRSGATEYEANWTPENADEIINELLKIFHWFDKWKQTNEELNLHKDKFLARETWDGFKRMILAYVGIIDYYVKGRGMTLVPKRLLSDPCEHLFSVCRYKGGGTNTVTTKSANSTVIRQNYAHTVRQNGVIKKGSYAQAPLQDDRTKMPTAKKRRY